MIQFILVLLMAFQATGSTTETLVAGIDRTFRDMRDFSADFEQISQDSLNRRRVDKGHLYLMKSGKMRWEYSTPEEKLFVSDGKTVYSYFPSDRLVHVDKVREAIDERMPLMFLLGRSNLRDEFTRFSLLQPTSGSSLRVLRMIPKRKTDLSEIEMEVDPANYHIRRLLLVYSGGDRSEFRFSNIRPNTGLKSNLFDFEVPPGVEKREGIQ
jgi:outer membrane lipoprotein carrier protein